jgi:hypothetical protein
MIIDDTALSGFLDGELTEPQMQQVREAIAESEPLADRLAELAQVDHSLQQVYSQIEQQPVPQSLVELLTEQPKKAEVISLSLWKRMGQSMQNHAAIAACLMVVIGYGMANFNRQNSELSTNAISANVAQVLFEQISGKALTLPDGTRVLPRATFKNTQQQFCRQYLTSNEANASENIACLQQNQWQLKAQVAVLENVQTSSYQTASGGQVLDATLDQMIEGNFYNQADEQALINNAWKQ